MAPSAHPHTKSYILPGSGRLWVVGVGRLNALLADWRVDENRSMCTTRIGHTKSCPYGRPAALYMPFNSAQCCPLETNWPFILNSAAAASKLASRLRLADGERVLVLKCFRLMPQRPSAVRTYTVRTPTQSGDIFFNYIGAADGSASDFGRCAEPHRARFILHAWLLSHRLFDS